MDFQHTISIPTKQSDDSGGGGLNRVLRYSGNSSGDAVRRQSSSSNVSFDVAASLFSSMQTLEASGRSLSSLLGGSASLGSSLPPTGAQLNLSGRGGFPVGGQGMGIGAGQNNLGLPPRNLMHLLPSPQMGGSLPYRNLDVDALLRHRQQQLGGNPFQVPARPDTVIRGGFGGYLPSSKMKGSINSSDVNDFTTEELMNELTRRRSERSRASAVLDTAMPAMFSADQLSKARLMNGGQPQDPRDSSHHANVDLANPYRMQSVNPRRGSEDSLDLLAATANINAMREKVAEEISKTSPTQHIDADTVTVRTIPTCVKPAKKTIKKKSKDENAESDASDTSEDEAAENERKKVKRNPSTSSFDVLLTALEGDLEKLDKKNEEKEKVPSVIQRANEDELLRRLSKDSLFSVISEDDLVCQPATHTQDNLSRKRKQSHLATLLNARSSFTMPSEPMESDAILYPAHGMNLDYARRLQTSHSTMASLESAMLRNDFARRQLAFRDLQRREFASRMMQNNLQNRLHNNLQNNKGPPVPVVDPKPEQQLKLPGKLPSEGKNVTLSDRDKPMEAKENKNEPPTTSIDGTGFPLRRKKEVEEPIKIPPEEALKIFLSAHGEKGETLREAVLKAITDSEGSLATIHSWDRSQGLRKCHSRTVVKTRRSRAQLKAFLTGVEPPKEPHHNRKRQKKSSSKKMDDVFGPPRDRW
mmetsp:Transcript_23191/g.35824  ORF Transcript_23191/g.35824 Transcript_23191/m.35824 type:complete len:701 (+) Transcript_23191:59-2161(+)